jgi:mono/diheme cytochrome c family protein
MIRLSSFPPGVAVFAALAIRCLAVSEPAAPSPERGREALFGRCFSHATVTREGYDALWKQWGLPAQPADFSRAVMERYGLHPAAYPNGDLPMGLRTASAKADAGIGYDCMLCHAGSLFGKPVFGAPNASLDLAGLFEDFAAAKGMPYALPFRISNVRGTTEATASAIFLIAFRDADLNLRFPADLGPIPDQMCEDTPALWLLKKKRTMYHNGQLDARSVRPLMSFMMSPLTNAAQFRKYEPIFADIRAFLLSLEAPKYPFAIDQTLANRGRELFEDRCSKCHGTYGPDGEYPNKIVKLDVIGTDPTLVKSLTSKVENHYRQSWLANEPGPEGKPYAIRYNDGYQAPPLDGVWASAPYFHNGSVPTLADVLNSKTRPQIFTRSYHTEVSDYDPERVGWIITKLEKAPGANVPAVERRRVYDTTQTGRGNGGHDFGDRFTDEERMAVVEYLKTL